MKEKEIEINGKKFMIGCNATTHRLYREQFSRGIFEDMTKLANYVEVQNYILTNLVNTKRQITSQELLDILSKNAQINIDEVIEIALKMTYICILTYNRKNGQKTISYEKWESDFEELNFEDNWIGEVAKLVADCFHGYTGVEELGRAVSVFNKQNK